MEIPSNTVPGRFYVVENERCNCPAGSFGRKCRHVGQSDHLSELERGIMERGKAMTATPSIEQKDPADLAAPSNVEQAIAYVYSKVDYVQKERKQGLGYSFAGEAAILNVVRPAMVEVGLTVRVHELLDVAREQVTNKNGNTSMYTTCRAVVRFAHAPSGTHVDVQALGEGADVGDKSANKAMTGALKYALRQTFALETGDDLDATSSNEYERPANPPRNQAKPPATLPAQHSAETEQFKALLKDATAKGVGFPQIAEVLGAPFGLEGTSLTNWLGKDGPAALSRWLGNHPTMKPEHVISRAADKGAE